MGVKKNISWLIFDKVFILILQFVIGIKIANHYGSFQYGKYSYAVSLLAFTLIILELLNTRIVKLYYYKYNFMIIASIVSGTKVFLSIIIFLVIFFSKFFYEYDNQLYFILILLSLDNILISSTLGIENYFDYRLNSRYIVLSNNIVKLISYLLQYLAILCNFSIMAIAFSRCIGDLFRVYILRYQYNKVYKVKNKLILNKKITIKILKESFFIWLSLVSYTISTNIDKIMLKKIIGLEAVGIYAIATQLIHILVIIIGPFQNTIFSELIKLYKINKEEYEKKYICFTKILTNIYIVGIPISYFILQKLFYKVFSLEYKKSLEIYFILAIVVLIKANVFLRSSHYTITNNKILILKSEASAAIVNIFLNFILIKKYGIYGAAMATLISQIISLWIIDLFSYEGRKLLKIHLQGFWIFDLKKYLKTR